MWIYDFNYVCAIVHTFAKMCGAFDVILYFVNPTFYLLINLLLIILIISVKHSKYYGCSECGKWVADRVLFLFLVVYCVLVCTTTSLS